MRSKTKLFFSIITAVVFLTFSTSPVSASNDVTVDPGGLSLYLSDLSQSYTLSAGDTFSAVVINTGTFVFSVEASSSFTLTSADDSDFVVTGNTGCTATETCGGSESTLVISCGAGVTSHDITVTPGVADSCQADTTEEEETTNNSAAPPPPAPSAPITIAPTTAVVNVTPSTPVSVTVGNVSHTVTVSDPVNGQVTITIASKPQTFTLSEGEEKLVDTDEDGVYDIFVRLDSISGNNADLTLASIPDLEFSINQALSQTTSRSVTLYFNSPEATQMAVSNDIGFDGVSYEDYTATKSWTLTSGNGGKTVYVKFKTSAGGVRTVSDTITLSSQTCPLTPESVYKHTQSNAVYYVTLDCTKRAFTNPNIFFTYFDSWSDVQTVTKATLDSISNDLLGFMPYGPNYDPKYGALVKIVKDPKVYLLLGNNKHWITAEAVFNGLNYPWNWIEDVDSRLLNKYTSAGEISYTDHHPNYTLIKYETDPKVYRLEPDPSDTNLQVKRWVPNETVFNSLNFRWDRIVTVSDTEIYETGEDLNE